MNWVDRLNVNVQRRIHRANGGTQVNRFVKALGDREQLPRIKSMVCVISHMPIPMVDSLK